jgi:hypothetical protein
MIFVQNSRYVFPQLLRCDSEGNSRLGRRKFWPADWVGRIAAEKAGFQSRSEPVEPLERAMHKGCDTWNSCAGGCAALSVVGWLRFARCSSRAPDNRSPTTREAQLEPITDNRQRAKRNQPTTREAQ